MDRTILHIDVNNFFASIEIMLNPNLKGLPVAVCGSEDDRHGIVLAKSYEAKKFGVKTAETVWQAKKKCPNLIIVPPQYEEYKKYSKLIQNIYYSYTDQVEPFGLDECWLDVTGSLKLFGNVENIAEEIKERVKKEIGVTVSIGVSFTKTFAKLGSDLKKPDAITYISKENFKNIVWPLVTNEIIGVGKSTFKILEEMNLKTIGELANCDISLLEQKLGKHGRILWKRVNGIDDEIVDANMYIASPKSIGNGKTFRNDLTKINDIRSAFQNLTYEISNKLKKHRLEAKNIQIVIRDNQFNDKQLQCELPTITSSSLIITNTAMDLFKKYKWNKPIRALTIRAINLIEEGTNDQISLFEEKDEYEKIKKIDKVMFEINNKFGPNSVKFSNINKKL
ncbi:DNA polymerase IV [Pseudostreptobacillus sp.]